eukprot:gene19540-50743_t
MNCEAATCTSPRAVLRPQPAAVPTTPLVVARPLVDPPLADATPGDRRGAMNGPRGEHALPPGVRALSPTDDGVADALRAAYMWCEEKRRRDDEKRRHARDPGDGKGPLPDGWGWGTEAASGRTFYRNHADRSTHLASPLVAGAVTGDPFAGDMSGGRRAVGERLRDGM